jgi:hypothetical protein
MGSLHPTQFGKVAPAELLHATEAHESAKLQNMGGNLPRSSAGPGLPYAAHEAAGAAFTRATMKHAKLKSQAPAIHPNKKAYGGHAEEN